MCLTNTVAANFTANVLLAIGAKPALIEEESEAAELAALADAVLINVGTLSPQQAEVMRAAVRVCSARSIPWVLDPVAVHLLDYRRQFVSELLAAKPTALRGNRAEIEFLLGSAHGLLASVPSLATDETDVIRLGLKEVRQISGGAPILQSVTATGCAQGAVVAAFLGWGQAPTKALESASKLMKRAAERALASARGPGSFQPALLDSLAELASEFV